MLLVAMVAGVSPGIGAANAVMLTGAGYRVVVNHRAGASPADEMVAPWPALALWSLAGRDLVRICVVERHISLVAAG